MSLKKCKKYYLKENYLMKTTKLVIGIVSIVLFFIVIFQSCAVGLGNAIEGNSETSGAGGTFLAFFMLP